MDSIQKNNKIKDLEEKIEANRVQMAIDKQCINVLQKEIHNAKTGITTAQGGVQIAQDSLLNIMQNFNEMFPNYSVEIK